MVDRRTRMPRLESHFPIRYWIGDAHEPRKGQAANVSPKGLFVATDNREAAGVPVTIDLAFPGPEVIRLRGVVAWSRHQPRQFEWVSQNGFGVRIEEAPEEWFEHIADIQHKADERERDREIRERVLGKRH